MSAASVGVFVLPAAPEAVPRRATSLPPIIQLAACRGAAYALSSDGAAFRLELGGIVRLPFTARVHHIACGPDHVVVSAVGGVWAWGDNAFGQCGFDDRRVGSPRLVRAVARYAGKVALCAAGPRHSGIVTPSAVVTWGGRAPLSGAPADVELRVLEAAACGGVGAVRGLAMGDAHMAALTGSGEVYWWGRHEGVDVVDVCEPTRVSGVLYGMRISSVLALPRGTLVVTAAGAVYGWGELPCEPRVAEAPRLLPLGVSGELAVSLHCCAWGAGGAPCAAAVTRAQALSPLDARIAPPAVLSQLWIANFAAADAFCVIVGHPVPRSALRLLSAPGAPEALLRERFAASMARLCEACVEPRPAADGHLDDELGYLHIVVAGADGAWIRVPTYLFASRCTPLHAACRTRSRSGSHGVAQVERVLLRPPRCERRNVFRLCRGGGTEGGRSRPSCHCAPS